MERSTTSTSNSPNKTLARILQLDPSLPDILREKYSERYSMLLQDMTNDAGEFLHNLNVVKHSDNEVKAVIQAFPTALSHASVNGKFPIHKALRSEVSVPFIPVLAAESIKFNIGGGEDKRGGLLSEDPQDPDSLNLLQSGFRRNVLHCNNIAIIGIAGWFLRVSQCRNWRLLTQ